MHGLHVYIITDLEGVCGIMNFPDWCTPAGYRNEAGCRFLTEEVNAVAAGFFAGGATAVTVWDGHGSGGSIRRELLDPRCALQGGVSDQWPRLNNGADAIAFVGQHAKSGTPGGQLAHTQTPEAIDFRINGISIGEYGQHAATAAEEGIPTIFAAGDLALVREAEALTPGVFTVAVKAGLGHENIPADTPAERVFSYRTSAVHYPRQKVLDNLRNTAQEAVAKLHEGKGSFAVPQLGGPNFIAAAEYRATSPRVAAGIGRQLPARRIKTRPCNSVTEAIRHFYLDLEWHEADNQEIFNIE